MTFYHLEFCGELAMTRKIIGILMGMLLIGAITPVVCASPTRPNQIPRFNTCYIVAEGELTEKDFPSIIGTSMWKIHYTRPFNDDRANVFFWFIRFNETSTVTIYSEENGEVLWQHQGDTVPQLRMVMFKGIYLNADTTEGKLHIEIRGTIRYIQIIEK